jgi:hypothetical protein
MNKKINQLVSFCCLAILTIAFIVSGCSSVNTNNNTESREQGSTDSAGFVSIFDGSTLKGWEGDTAVWHVEDGAIVGQVTPESTPLKANTFLIWKDGKPGDFELTAEYQISSEGNSGIQYRSEAVEGVPFGLRGYQMDIDGANTYTGQNYEERARSIMAFRGQKVTLPPVADSISNLVKNNVWSVAVINDSLGNPDSLKAKINAGWNTCRIVANGNHLQHYINNVLMCDVTDDDTTNRKETGLIGLQLHAGHIMKVSFKNIRLKELK